MSQSSVKVIIADHVTSRSAELANYLRFVHHYQVETVDNESKLRTQLKEKQDDYEVVLIDNVLSSVNLVDLEPAPVGVRLTKEIKAKSPEVQIIIFINPREEEMGLEALR